MKIGVIGTGNMGENHIRTYLKLQDQCQFVGIYDNNQHKGQQIAKKYNVKQFQSIDDLLQSVDAVSIAVPTEFHYETGLACIKHHVHMLMEKPIANTVDQANELIHKAKQAGIKLQVGHIELFNPLIQILTKELENETIIGMAFSRMGLYEDRIKNADVVNDLMIHDLYIFQELLKDSVTEFYALGNEIENTTKHAAVIIRSKQGVTAQLTASFKSLKKVRTIQILTEDAFIDANILERTINITRSTTENINKIPVPLTKKIQIADSVQPLTVELLDFINCITLDREPFVSGENGRDTLLLTNKISSSISNS